MQALKALVIFLGVLIVIGMGILAYGITLKFGEWQAKKDGEPTPPAATATATAGTWAGDLKVTVPAGAQVAETVVAGGRMIVRLSLADDGQRYLIFDLGTGQQVGAIELQPGGAR